MKIMHLAAAAGCAAFLAACEEGPDFSQEDVSGPPATPRVSARVIENYDGLSGRVLDLALMPSATPYFSRAFVAVDTGGFDVIDFAEGGVTHIDAPEVGALATAPDFQLRGSSAPLLIGAMGELAAPRAWVFLAEDGVLVDIPMEPIETEGVIRGVCADRATPALLDLLVITDPAIERWRISDQGGDLLSAVRVDTIPAGRAFDLCASHDGAIVGVSGGGARIVGGGGWGFSDGSDVASVTRADGAWAIVTRPSERGATLVGPLDEEVDLSFDAALNTPGMTAPQLVTASAANFGGPFSDGLAVVAESDRVYVVELGGVIADAKAALMRPSPDAAARTSAGSP